MPRTLATNRTLVKNYGTSLSFPGAAATVNIYSTGFDSAFNGQEFTIMGWGKVASSTVWTDATTRRYFLFQADANNLVRINKFSTNNTIQYVYTAASVVKATTQVTSATGWVHIAITASKTADQMITYFNGVQTGATQTGLGAWTGALTSTLVNIGSGSSAGGSTFNGFLDDWKIYNTALTPDQILQTYLGLNISTSLIAWYKFDEGSGTTANDSSGNGFTGSILSATYSTDVNSVPRTLATGRSLAISRSLAI